MKITVTPIEKLAVRLLQTTALRVTIPQSRVLSLGPLSLTTPTMAEGLVEGQLISELLGVTEGSTLTLIDNAGGRVALSGGNLVAGPTATDFETGTSHQVTIRETLAAAENSPRETTITISVTNVFEQPALNALTLPEVILADWTVSISGATPGSTITGTLPVGWSLNSAARTITIASNADLGAQNWLLTETLDDSPNSPRTSTGTGQVSLRPTLQSLTLSSSSVAENSAQGQTVGELLGVTSGSTLTLIDNAGGRFALSGANLTTGPTATDFETGTTHQVTVRETLAEATNGTRDTVLTITVTNVFEGPTLQPLTLPSIVNIPTTLNIVGATAGSTITGTLPAGWTLNSAARTITIAAEAEGSFQNWSLTESIADSPNSPRTSTGTIQIVPPTNLQLLAQSQAALAIYDYTNLGHGLGNSGWWGLPAVEGGAVGAWLNCKSFPDQSFQEWFDAQPGMEFTPVATFSGAGNIQDYGEILGPRSWRGFRDSNGSFNVNTVPTQAGKVYALSFDLSAYDATPPSSLNGVRLDTVSGEGNLSWRYFVAAGHIKAFYWSLGNPIPFSVGGHNRGYRVDNVKIVEVGRFNIGHHVASQRPIYNKGLLLDGVDDYVRIPLLPNGTNYPSDVTIVYLAETVDETFMLTGTNNSSVFAAAADTNTSSPHTGFAPAAYAVDGETLASPTRTTLGAAITEGLPAVVRVEGINLSRSDITELRTAWSSAGYFLSGRAMPIAILDRTAPDYARALAWAEAEAMRQALALEIWTPQSLFAANEPGVWLDPSDMDTLFNAVNGVPASVGGPVGLVLDKSQGLERSADLLTDAATQFSLVGSWAVVNGPKSVTLARDAVSNSRAVFGISGTGPGVYEVTFDLNPYDGASQNVTSNLVGMSDNFANSRFVSGVGSYRFVFPATTSLTFSLSNSNQGARLDNIVIKKIAGNHFVQATAAKRPILSQDANGLLYLQGDGVDDCLVSALPLDPLGAEQAQAFAAVETGGFVPSNIFASSEAAVSGGASRPSAPGSFAMRVFSAASDTVSFVSQGTTRSSLMSNLAANSRYVIGMTSSIPDSVIAARANGSDLGSSSGSQGTGTYLPYVAVVLAHSSGMEFFPGKFFGGIIRFGPSISARSIDMIESWLNEKAGAY